MLDEILKISKGRQIKGMQDETQYLQEGNGTRREF